MRITNTSMIKNYMSDTQQNLTRMNKINEQINTSKVVNRISDDPHKAIRIMNLNNEIRYTEKYNYNIDETVGWMNNTDTSLENLGTLLGDIKQSLLQIGNGTYSDDELKSIRAEANEKIKEIADVMNTTYAGKYMFGGTNVDEAPMKVEEIDGVVTLKINSNSNTEDLRVDVSEGINIDYNISVGEIFNSSDNEESINFLNEINNISSLLNDLTNGDESAKVNAKEKLLGTTKENIDKLYSHALDKRTSLGVRVSTAEKVKELNEENVLNMKEALSLDQDVDQVQAFIELKSAELVYQASIQVGTKLIQPTILDYL